MKRLALLLLAGCGGGGAAPPARVAPVPLDLQGPIDAIAGVVETEGAWADAPDRVHPAYVAPASLDALGYVVMAPLGAHAAVLQAGVSGELAFRVAVTRDGTTWTLAPPVMKPSPDDVASVAADREGWVDVVITDDTDRALLYRLDPARPTEVPAPLEVVDYTNPCRVDGARWWAYDVDDGGERLAHVDVAGALHDVALERSPYGKGWRDCTADAVLLRDEAPPGRLLRCDDRAACREILSGAPDDAVAALVGDGAIAAWAKDGVIHVRVDGDVRARDVVLPPATELEAVVAWSGAPYAIVRDAGGARASLSLAR